MLNIDLRCDSCIPKEAMDFFQISEMTDDRYF